MLILFIYSGMELYIVERMGILWRLRSLVILNGRMTFQLELEILLLTILNPQVQEKGMFFDLVINEF